MTNLEPQIDLTKIELPSDKLTLKALRTAFPDDEQLRVALEDIRCMMDAESRFARSVFQAALRGRPTRPEIRKSYLEDDGLAQAYIEYGVAKGLNHADELLRNVEAQADAQALSWGARGGRNF